MVTNGVEFWRMAENGKEGNGGIRCGMVGNSVELYGVVWICVE